jgi:hypothetical protein
MNILVVAPILLSNIDGSIGQNTIFTINEVYLMGQFDAILLLVDEKASFEENFSFAKVYKRYSWKLTNLDFAIDVILASLKQMGTTINGNCLFTIMCENDSLVEQIAKKAQPNNNFCFMPLSDLSTMNNFMELPLTIQDCQQGCNFFMEKMAKYMTKTSGRTRNILVGKVNKLKWMHIHWIWKPPS